MRRAILAMLALTLVPGTTLAAAEPVVLKPASPWNVDFATDRCRMQRLFGEGENQHLLSIEQFWPSNEAGVSVAGPAFKRFRSLQRTQVRVSDTREPIRSTAFTGDIAGYGAAVIFSTLRFDRNEGEYDEGYQQPFGKTGQMDLALGKEAQFIELRQAGRAVRLETGRLDAAFDVLNQCTRDLLRDWGLDAERHLTALSGPRWINQDPLVRRITSIYPSSAAAIGEQGIMRMRVIVTEEGTVESCTIVKASNTTRLESPACEVMKRARFEPARDAEGKPLRSYYVTAITYRMG